MFTPGETITSEYHLPFRQEDVAALYLSFRQDDRIILSKQINRTNIINSTSPVNTSYIIGTLTQEESLLFDDNKQYYAQWNALLINGQRITSEEMRGTTGTQHKREVIAMPTFTGNIHVDFTFTGETNLITAENKNGIVVNVTGPNSYSTTFTYADNTNEGYDITNLPTGEYVFSVTSFSHQELNVTSSIEVNGTATSSVLISNDVTVNVVINHNVEHKTGTLNLILQHDIHSGAITQSTFANSKVLLSGPTDSAVRPTNTITYTFGTMISSSNYTRSVTVPNVWIGSYYIQIQPVNITGYTRSNTTCTVNGQPLSGTYVAISENASTTVVVKHTYTQT